MESSKNQPSPSLSKYRKLFHSWFRSNGRKWNVFMLPFVDTLDVNLLSKVTCSPMRFKKPIPGETSGYHMLENHQQRQPVKPSPRRPKSKLSVHSNHCKYVWQSLTIKRMVYDGLCIYATGMGQKHEKNMKEQQHTQSWVEDLSQIIDYSYPAHACLAML